MTDKADGLHLYKDLISNQLPNPHAADWHQILVAFAQSATLPESMPILGTLLIADTIDRGLAHICNELALIHQDTPLTTALNVLRGSRDRALTADQGGDALTLARAIDILKETERGH